MNSNKPQMRLNQILVSCLASQYKINKIITVNLYNIAVSMAPNLSIEELSSLYQPDNIRDGTSLQKLGNWDGYLGLQYALRTNFKTGLTHNIQDHEERMKQWGDNQPIIKPPKTILFFIKENFQDDMLRILCASAVVSLVLGVLTIGVKNGWIQGISIMIAVIISVTVTSTNNYLKERRFQKLNSMATAKNVNVIREGQVINMSVYDLLVGDVVIIQAGQILSVDGILIQGHCLSVDESSVTGQAVEIKKMVPSIIQSNKIQVNPFLISSSKVMEGTGKMVVTCIGRNSYFGKLKIKIQSADDRTPLQQKLSVLADQIGTIGMYSATATFIVTILNYLYFCIKSDDFLKSLISMKTAYNLVQYFIIAISIVVVAVPEGLPLAVTISLAYSVDKMRKQNNLVRYLSACETMGGVNNICSDKTGTLTKNHMMVSKLYIDNRSYQNIDASIATENTIKLLCLSICNNSTANPIIYKNQSGAIVCQSIGNKTQCALLEMSYKMGFDYKKFRVKDNTLKIFPFCTYRKKMATVYQDSTKVNYVFVKGAPDFLLQHCTRYICQNGRVNKIKFDFLTEMKQTIQQFAAQPLRTILLAYKQITGIPQFWEDVESDLIVIGLVGIKDPLKQGIKQAVQTCHRAGVKVRMVTGDNKMTAIAIAKQAGILPSYWQPQTTGLDTSVMQGRDFRNFVGGLIKNQQGIEVVRNINNFRQVAENLCVLARSSPDDKYLLATGLKNLQNIVAMTGDGTNDAPALKKADIGFAMGINGTQIAKQASGIILLDDNFKSIVTAMKWGRNIFDCIRKYLQFQLTVNFVALVIAFAGSAILSQSPLNPIQMLWVNLIMDTLASLALATEPPNQKLLHRKPYSRQQSLITPNMWRNIIFHGLMQIVILGVILFKGPELLQIPSSIGVSVWNQENGKHYSIFFNVFVLLQIFNQVNARKLRHDELNVFQNFFNNPLFLVIVVLTIFIQFQMVRFGGKSLKTVPLTFKQNVLCIIIGSTSLWTGLLIRSILPQNFSINFHGIQIGNKKYLWKATQLFQKNT